jgi:hypothetical protein
VGNRQSVRDKGFVTLSQGFQTQIDQRDKFQRRDSRRVAVEWKKVLWITNNNRSSQIWLNLTKNYNFSQLWRWTRATQTHRGGGGGGEKGHMLPLGRVFETPALSQLGFRWAKRFRQYSLIIENIIIQYRIVKPLIVITGWSYHPPKLITIQKLLKLST